jgi:hypothetical protein
MTALQIEGNPQLISHIAEGLLKFEMPGNTLVPHLQSQVGRWMPLMGADFDRITKELVRHVYETLGDVRMTGVLIMEVAAERGIKVGPISPRLLKAAVNRLGGPGYGLIGEALLQRVGLGYIYRAERDRQDSAFRLYGGAYERVRSLLRDWVASQIDFRLEAA